MSESHNKNYTFYLCSKIAKNALKKYRIKNRDSEDILQTIMEKTVKNFHKYDKNIGELDRWVERIVRNVVIDFNRKDTKVIEIIYDTDLIEDNEYHGGYEDYINYDNKQQIEFLVDCLAKQEKELIFDKYYLCYRSKELEDKYETNSNTINIKLFHIKNKLRKRHEDSTHCGYTY